MAHPLSTIAEALGAKAEGDAALIVTGAAEPQEADADQLAVALGPRFIARLSEGRARVALLPDGTDWRGLGLAGAILVPRGRLAMARLTAHLAPESDLPKSPAATAIADGCDLGAGVGIGHYSVVRARARIGAGTRIGHHVTIAPGAVIGKDCRIHDGVRIGPRCRIGDGVTLHPNVVIGADGFSFVTEAPARVEEARQTLGVAATGPTTGQRWEKIHSLGGVEIGDGVEIGAQSAVDAGTLRATQVGPRTKIDNLVQIGHNVRLGADCLVCAQAGIAGSAEIGDRTVIGGKAGVGDNLSVGPDVVLGGGTIVLANVPAGRIMLGYPATPMDRQIESYKALRRLPRLIARLGGGEKTGSQDDPE